MRKYLFSAALILVVSQLLIACQTKEEKMPVIDVETTILKLEDDWDKALVASDVDGLDKIYADTLIYTHSNGSVDDKATYITKIRSGETKYESMTRNDRRIKVYGDTAVVTCHWDVHVTARGAKIDTNARYIHVYSKIGEDWKMVAHQATRIAE
ncbi:MAG: nuclear transport factor 2 family protein [Acidobacteria bacterium]|nr:nuclear transport factor 2 family protein [Acidobacteriota bacterium]